MEFPTVLALIFVFIVWFAYRRKKNAIQLEKDAEDFWNQESKANSVRKKSLDDLDYIYIKSEDFSFIQSDDIKIVECQKTINSLSLSKIVNLTGLTNTELKLKYGSPNLTLLSEYDENFTTLVRTLNSLGKRLVELGIDEHAVLILEYAIKIKTDISETYKLLYKLYNKSGDINKVQILKDTASELNSINKKSILKYLNSAL